MTRKEIRKKIFLLASKIPPEITKVRQFTGKYDEETKQPIMSEYEVWSNHSRRIRRLFYRTKGDMGELQKYFERFNMTLKEDSPYEST